MLIGYVSDERYVALADVVFEFLRDGQRLSTRSTASGAVEADLAPGAYCVTFCRPGFRGTNESSWPFRCQRRISF